MLIFFGLSLQSYSQRIVNHDYPRIATLTWLGGNTKWLSKFDLILGGETDDSLTFRSVKSLNPDVNILYTTDWNSGGPFRIWGQWESFPAAWRLRHSDGSYIRHSTGAYFADPTDYCGLYNGEKYLDALPRRLMEKVDWVAFDGVSSDGTWSFPYNTGNNIDLNRNGINDFTEHGEDWIRSKWQAGQNKMRNNLRTRYSAKWGNPNAKLIFFWTVNDTMCIHVSNGMGWENMYHNAPDNFIDGFNLFNRWDTIGVLPRINVITFDLDYDLSHAPASRPKDYFRFVRFGLCTALLYDVYFMTGEGRDHHWTNYYDEYDVKLGYPKGRAKKLSNGCYVRFFDNGVSIVNPTSSNKTVTNNDLVGLSGYNGPYYRFKGNQDPQWNNGSLFSSVTLVSTAASGGSQNIGDGIILVKNPSTVVADIVIDNAYSGTSPASSKSTRIGFSWDSNAEYDAPNPTWFTSSQTSLGNSNYYDSYYAYSGSGSAKAIYRPTINVSGRYKVYEWHGWRGRESWNYREASNVPCSIFHANGMTNMTIDQTKNYSTWNLLGTFDFNGNGMDSVVITNNANGYVVADAFKFEYVQGSDLLPPQQSIPPNGATFQPTSLKMVWRKVTGAIKYHLQIASDSSFQSLVVNDSSLTDTTYQAISLANSKTYFWRVHSSNLYGSSVWSTIWKFQTIPNLSVTGSVLFDQNNNRTKDLTDPALASWKVYIEGTVNDSILTNVDGSFSFNFLPFGNYTIREYVIPGWTQSIPSQPYVYYVILDSTRTTALCNFLNYASSTIKCNIFDGWNTVSLPLLTQSSKVKDVFPSSASSAFYYRDTYIPTDNLQFGTGYWLKFQQPHSLWIAGTKVNSDTIDLYNGWNLFGSISDTLLSGSIVTLPPNIITSYVIGYEGVLTPVDTLIPGKGYWVKTNQSGKLIISKPKQIISKESNDFDSFKSMNSLTFFSGNFRDQKFFFTNNINFRNTISLAELPPAKEGTFDVRFLNAGNLGSFAALFDDINPKEQNLQIVLSSATAPLTIKWQIVDEKSDYRLETENGEKIFLQGNGEVVLENRMNDSDYNREMLKLVFTKQSGSILPSYFNITQNYPNPFNNSTSISISLPKASHVRVDVYNILGKHAAMWLDKDFEAGNHIFDFDASELSSGVYFYRVIFNPSTENPLEIVRRMILIK